MYISLVVFRIRLFFIPEKRQYDHVPRLTLGVGLTLVVSPRQS